MKGKNMNTKFGELTKGLAQSVTRRAALKKFGGGLAGMALACLGLANKAEAKRCLPAGSFCGSGGPTMPYSCLTSCCSHEASSVFGFGHYYCHCT